MFEKNVKKVLTKKVKKSRPEKCYILKNVINFNMGLVVTLQPDLETVER